MSRVATTQLAPKLRVEVFPETYKIRRDLNGTVIGGKKLKNQRHGSPGNRWSLGHAKEILEA